MSEFDLVIRNGTVINGTGAARRRADVAVVGDRVVAVGAVDGDGRAEIDAEGHIVSPGFVDGHTHMDAQVFWDHLGTSSCWHGVTTVAMGNCGFTLAPARPDERALVVRSLERAEDISAIALAEGVNWTWSTFAEYLDAVDALPKGLNYASSIGHSALRTWAMGERAFAEAATDDDLEVMTRELTDALHAGAAGFTTSRSGGHATSDDRPVASRLATWDEVCALVEVLGRESDGIFETTPNDDVDADSPAHYRQRMQDLTIATGVPIVFGLFAAPHPAFDRLEQFIDDTVARGGHMWGQTHCRGVTVMQSFQTRFAFDVIPEWREVRSKSLAEQRVLLMQPDVRARLVHAAHHGDFGTPKGAEARRPDYDALTVMLSPYLRNPTVGDLARERGVDPVELMIDLALERDFELFFLQNISPQRDGDLVPMMKNPNTAMTFSDSGAHVSQISDASIQTHMLAYWVREREAFTLEEAISMMARQPAEMWRLPGRGVLRAGNFADITIFDPDTVAPDMPRVVNDLPGGERRLIQTAQGYKATVVNGQVLTSDGQATEARPGKLLRRAQRAAI